MERSSAVLPRSKDLAEWLKAGRIRYPHRIIEGLAAAPAAFAGVFRSYVGKLLVRVAEE